MTPARPHAAAALDPASGRIIGYALGDGGYPAEISLLVDDQVALRQLAVLPVDDLGAAIFANPGAPPTATCCFAMRIPRSVEGTRIRVTAQSRGAGPAMTLLDVDMASALSLARYREGSVMSDTVVVDQFRVRQGVLYARITSPGSVNAPAIEISLRGQIIAAATLQKSGAYQWDLSAILPADMLDEGVLVLQLMLPDGSVAGRYTIVAGAALADDLASEVATLRAELDHLKRSFRKAMAPGVLTRDERPLIVADALTQMDHLLELRDRRDLAAIREAQTTDWEDESASWEID